MSAKVPEEWRFRDYKPESGPSSAPWEEFKERLLDDDGPILLSLREEVGNQILGEGLCDGDGEPLGFNDPLTERIGDQISNHVKDSLATFLNG